MEVKIKDGNGYVEADWTIEDGVMVVSPKKAKFEPKDGDVVVINEGIQIFIVKDHLSDIHGDCYCGWDFENKELFSRGSKYYDRYATEEEKQKLFDKLAEKGLAWDAERKELVKIKWEPKVGDKYFRPDFNKCRFLCYEGNAQYHTMKYIKDHVNKNWCFKTEQECQEFCDRLNIAISQVKP